MSRTIRRKHDKYGESWCGVEWYRDKRGNKRKHKNVPLSQMRWCFPQSLYPRTIKTMEDDAADRDEIENPIMTDGEIEYLQFAEIFRVDQEVEAKLYWEEFEKWEGEL